MDAIEIRSATLHDAGAIAELSGELGYPAEARRLQKRLEVILNADDHAVFLACVAGRVVGWVHVFVALRAESDPFAELGGLVVAEADRGRGIGRALVAAACEWAAARDLVTLRVRSQLERDEARAFYDRLGFTVTKTQHVFDKPIE